MRLILALALTACAPFAARNAVHQSPPIALPDIQHGHRIERIPAGYLCFGGYHRGSAKDRGVRATSLLRPGDDTWLQCGSLHHAHSFFASTCIGGKAYAIGEAVERFDASTNQWQVVVEPGQLPRSHFGAAAIGNEVFVLGGFPKIGTGFFIVDIESGNVRTAKPPPTFAPGDHLHFVFALNNELHVLGGIDGVVSEMHQSHWVRRDGKWHALPDCPEDMWTKFSAHVVHNGKLYAFDSLQGWCYDPKHGAWQRRAKLPRMVAMPVAVAADQSIWVVGGMQVKDRANVFWHYDIVADEWKDQLAARPALPR